MTNTAEYDLAIIGGGINGCGIARDAAGRGLKVILIEQGDFASATSAWSSKLIHGGLRYLEQYQFRLVREALQEREVLLKIAPHLIRPLPFILPHDESMRPAWMIRIGLFLYDHIGGTISLPGSRGVAFPDAVYSAGLKAALTKGFFYSDAQVDDARLTLLNALSAHEHGADVRPHTRLIQGQRHGDTWLLTLQAHDSNTPQHIRVRGVVNAGGPWVKHLLDDTFHVPMTAGVRLIKGSHIVVPRIHEHKHAYILQNEDKRVVFIIPYEDQFSLIGTTDVAVDRVEDAADITPEETDYLLRAVNRFLAIPLQASDVVWRYAGVRPLYDDGSANPSEITRDYVLKIDHQGGALPLLSIFGGKITTYRRLAEHALQALAPYFPAMTGNWTDREALPGGDMGTLENAIAALQRAYPALPADYLGQLVRRYGSRTSRLLVGVQNIVDLGVCFGSGPYLLSEREIDYCIKREWAKQPDDILWRRTKCGLHMSVEEREKAARFIAARCS
ncbi:MAG: glycerol-3-phosphate dehydrogenase [Betaproteobacteria bacterium]|nr:glycerol-3-phosphate dehydrogenase [Betaproteobacteria bacterium]